MRVPAFVRTPHRFMAACVMALLAMPIAHTSAADMSHTAQPGIYLSSSFEAEVKKTRMAYTVPDAPMPTFLVVAKGKPLQLSNVHETWDLAKTDDVKAAPGDALFLTSGGKKGEYRHIPQKTADAYVFNLLFKGCYKDETQKRYCLGDGRLSIDGKPRTAQLQLDSSELDIRGNNLKIEGDNLFWVFVPVEKGWHVFRSDWASAEGYAPFDLNKPWKILTRE